ncbi:unnamed protein product [Moneuplotes crassus]|uniref:Uncharacterized protein n=1 Tax=Euplotes crassus TaxID=5936 RepID=A0AAD1UCV9_EUPCR|nr:unnamed protein product [Moneuplotes crassus]
MSSHRESSYIRNDEKIFRSLENCGVRHPEKEKYLRESRERSQQKRVRKMTSLQKENTYAKTTRKAKNKANIDLRVVKTSYKCSFQRKSIVADKEYNSQSNNLDTTTATMDKEPCNQTESAIISETRPVLNDRFYFDESNRRYKSREKLIRDDSSSVYKHASIKTAPRSPLNKVYTRNNVTVDVYNDPSTICGRKTMPESPRAHPFYLNTIQSRRSRGMSDFGKMTRFDSNRKNSVNKTLSDTYYDKNQKKRASQSKKKRKGSNKQRSSRRTKSFVGPSNGPFQNCTDSAACISALKEYETLKGKLNIEKLSKAGLWKQIPQIARNEIWIRHRDKNIKKERKKSKRKETSECSFNPQINKKPFCEIKRYLDGASSKFRLDGQPQKTYYDLKKSMKSSYSHKAKEAKEIKKKEMYELYGKHLEYGVLR